MLSFLARRTRSSVKQVQSKSRRRLRLEVLEGRQMFSAGGLDPAFGSGGKVVKDYGSVDSIAASAAVRTLFVYPAADLANAGKVLAGGHLGIPNVTKTGMDFTLLRYNPDGTPDTTFGTDGMVTTDFNRYDDVIHALAVDNTGRIVVAGSAQYASSFASDGRVSSLSNEFAMARYTANGQLDTAVDTGFGKIVGEGQRTGKLTTRFAGGSSTARALTILPDGDLLVGGHAYSATTYSDFALARYNSDGTLDTVFGSDGLVTTPMVVGAASQDYARSMAVQGDGKILLGGSTHNGTDYDFAVARYHADGSLDGSFGSGGKVKTPVGAKARKSSTGPNDEAVGLSLDADGRIILAGYTTNSSGLQDTALVRYHNTGALDTGFGSGGKVISDLGGSDLARGVAVQPDGKIVVAGAGSFKGTGSDFVLARYTAGGVLDSTFGAGGKVATAFITGSDEAIAVALQEDGKIIAGGYASRGFALARYLGDPPAAPTNLAATAVSSSQINLTWTAGSTNVTGYIIERSTDGMNFSQIASVPAAQTSYIDGELTPLTKYYYRLRAYNANGVSNLSTVVSISLQAP